MLMAYQGLWILERLDCNIRDHFCRSVKVQAGLSLDGLNSGNSVLTNQISDLEMVSINGVAFADPGS
jgi:hypothetical protein